jgi:hypothetical protein
LAYQQLKNVERARDNLEEARAMGLKTSLLTPSEQKMLVDLEEYVGVTKVSQQAGASSGAGL